MQFHIFENKDYKLIRSKNYNYNFNKKTGYFERWGKTKEDDPDQAPVPEILDIEISTICHQKCKSCYKTLTPQGENMSLATYKKILDKLCWEVKGKKIPFIQQVAFGIGSIDANPDLFEIFKYTRDRGVIPNLTINGFRMTSEYFDQIATLCGACAVSHYEDNACYGAVEQLTSRGMNQCNIHQLLCQETLEQCHKVIDDKLTDPRLEKLNAIVYLILKPKGDRNTYQNIKNRSDYVDLIKHAVDAKVNFGFDSCFAPIFADIAKDVFPKEQLDSVIQCCEPCESFGLFSSYIDVKGNYFPCSFIPGTSGWEEGIDLLKIDSFTKDVWNCSQVCEARKKSLTCGRKCLPFPEIYNLE